MWCACRSRPCPPGTGPDVHRKWGHGVDVWGSLSCRVCCRAESMRKGPSVPVGVGSFASQGPKRCASPVMFARRSLRSRVFLRGRGRVGPRLTRPAASARHGFYSRFHHYLYDPSRLPALLNCSFPRDVEGRSQGRPEIKCSAGHGRVCGGLPCPLHLTLLLDGETDCGPGTGEKLGAGHAASRCGCPSLASCHRALTLTPSLGSQTLLGRCGRGAPKRARCVPAAVS